VATELTSGSSDIHPEGLRRSLERLRWGMDTKAGMAERLSWPSVDLQLVTIDSAGRIPLRRATTTTGWEAATRLWLTVHDGVLWLSSESGRAAGVDLILDRRLRLQLPYGVRVTTPFRTGARLVMLAVGDGGTVAAAPLARFLERFLGGI
jgi:hypothetical protein